MTIVGLTTGIAILIVGGAIWLMPLVTRPTLPFGVRVPASRHDEPVIGRARRSFQWRIGVITGCLTALAVALAGDHQWLSAVLPLVAIVAQVSCYQLARRRIRAAKREGAWFDGVAQTVTVDTAWRTEPERVPWLWLSLPVAVVAGTVATGLLRYPDLPTRLAIRFDASGHAARWVDKSPWSAFSVCMAQVFVTALVAGLMVATYRSRADSDQADPAGSTRDYRVFLGRTAKALFTMIALVNVTSLLAALQIWQLWRPTGAAVALSVLPVGVGVVVLLVVMLRMGQGGSRLAHAASSPAGLGARQDVGRDDDRLWKAGLFYVNRDDPAMLVGKRFGVGWTLNLGNPKAWWVVAVIILVPIAVAVAAQT